MGERIYSVSELEAGKADGFAQLAASPKISITKEDVDGSICKRMGKDDFDWRLLTQTFNHLNPIMFVDPVNPPASAIMNCSKGGGICTDEQMDEERAHGRVFRQTDPSFNLNVGALGLREDDYAYNADVMWGQTMTPVDRNGFNVVLSMIPMIIPVIRAGTFSETLKVLRQGQFTQGSFWNALALLDRPGNESDASAYRQTFWVDSPYRTQNINMVNNSQCAVWTGWQTLISIYCSGAKEILGGVASEPHLCSRFRDQAAKASVPLPVDFAIGSKADPVDHDAFDLLDSCRNIQKGNTESTEREGCYANYLTAYDYHPIALGIVNAHQITYEWQVKDGYNQYGLQGRNGLACTANCHAYQDSTDFDYSKSNANCYPEKGVLQKAFLPQFHNEDQGVGVFLREQMVFPGAGDASTSYSYADEEIKSVLPDPASKSPSEVMKGEHAKQQTELVVELMKNHSNRRDLIKANMFDGKIEITQIYVGQVLVDKILNPKVRVQDAFRTFTMFTNVMDITVYNALIAAWKIKYANNCARPMTNLQNTELGLHGNMYKTFAGRKNTYDDTEYVQDGIYGQDVRPYVKTMPHSGYPSGSYGIFENWQSTFYGAVPHLFPRWEDVPQNVAYKAKPYYNPADMSDVFVFWRSFDEYMREGVQSRLWSGLHYPMDIDYDN